MIDRISEFSGGDALFAAVRFNDGLGDFLAFQFQIEGAMAFDESLARVAVAQARFD